MSFVKKQYALVWEFFRTHLAKRFFGCTVAFLLLCAASYGVLSLFSEQAQAMVESFIEEVRASGLLDEEGNIGMAALLGNNLKATLMATVVGLIPFVFLPVLSLVLNAVLIGAVLAMAAMMGAAVWQLILLGLAPHGIFEIPAILLGIAMGLCLCSGITAAIRKKPDAPPLESLLPQVCRLTLCAVLPLLTLAALVETTITPLLLQLAL